MNIDLNHNYPPPKKNKNKNKTNHSKQGHNRASYLGYRYNNERPSSSALGDNCHKLGVDGAEVVVMDVLGDGDTFEALLPVGHLSVDVSKLGTSVGWTP